MAYLGDTNSQVDVWDNFARVISPGGTPSPLLDYEVSEEDQMRSMLDVSYDKELPVTIPDGEVEDYYHAHEPIWETLAHKAPH